jgi:hypothetical protein
MVCMAYGVYGMVALTRGYSIQQAESTYYIFNNATYYIFNNVNVLVQ